MSESREDKGDRTEQAERRFDQWQYDFLKKCSEKGEEGIKEWNEWRKANPGKDICLDKGDFRGWHLRGINLMQGVVGSRLPMPEQGEVDYSGEVYLGNANFEDADVENAWFARAHLRGSRWWYASARGADFTLAELHNAQVAVCELDGCRFGDTVFIQAQLTGSSVRGARFLNSDLCGCMGRAAIVDGATEIWECKVDMTTDFTGVGLEGAIVDPATKQLLEYNIRRMGWEKWYKDGNEPIRGGRWVFRWRRLRLCTNELLRWLVRRFWAISDYGISTKQIIWTFFKWAFAFALVYYFLGALDYHVLGDRASSGIVSNLFVGKDGSVPGWLVPIRAVYFSVVTMTTLGFGDMYANCQSLLGHVLLTLQVLLGYVLLGALVTRFAVLFTAGGPAGKFAKSERTRQAISDKR